jgi:hypothetical protein
VKGEKHAILSRFALFSKAFCSSVTAVVLPKLRGLAAVFASRHLTTEERSKGAISAMARYGFELGRIKSSSGIGAWVTLMPLGSNSLGSFGGWMLRKFGLLVVLALSLSLSAHAQSLTDKIEVFGGYSFMHYDTSPSFNSNGWELAGQYKVMSWLGAVADIDGHYGTFEGINPNLHDYLIGPQVSFPARVSPFAHVLIGASHFSAGGASSNSFATGFGFGIDDKVAPSISWRVVQLDFIRTRLFGVTENNTRISTGIVIHF